jgi:hypothetical protein
VNTITGRSVGTALQIAVALVLVICWYSPEAKAQTIWLSPRNGPGAAVDFMDMFKRGAPWRVVASHVQVLEVGAAAWYSDDDLHRIMQVLQAHNIALEVGMGLLTGSERCGIHVEGYTARAQSLHDATRLKAAAVNVDYFGMDEPLWFGHRYSGRNACHSSSEDIVADVAEKVKQVKSVFPHAKIGDVEPVSGAFGMSWVDELEKWFDDYQAATGDRLAFFRADIQWNSSWQEPLRRLRTILRRRGIPLQIIYNSGAHSDAEWTNDAMEHAREYEVVAKLPLDAAVFQCWTDNPSRDLPESDPATLTGLAFRYLRWKQGR